MAKGRELKGRIKSVENTRKITRTMEMVATAQMKRVAVIALTANRGLAGAFNANLIKEARTTILGLEGKGITVDLHAIGKKGLGYFRYVGRNAVTSRTDISDR